MKTFFRRLALYIFAIWSFFPLYWLLNTSFKTSKDALARPPTFIFKPILKNYLDVIQNNEVWGYFVDSLIVALGTTFFGLLIGIPAAYVLARFKFKGNADFGFWILSTRMTPPIAMLIPFFIMLFFIVSKFKTKINYNDKKLIFLFVINIVPIILMFLTSLFIGAKIRTM